MIVIERIINILIQEGFPIEYCGCDLDLREYISESIQFISFIVDLEAEFGIEVPDEHLRYDILASLHSFSKMIEACMFPNEDP